MHEKFVNFVNELNHSISSIKLYFSLQSITTRNNLASHGVMVPCCVVFFDMQASPGFKREKNVI